MPLGVRMSTCRICTEDKSHFIMNNKWVCMTCDELLFDLEIECEEMELQTEKQPTASTKAKPGKATVTITKK